jgi:hypothetical protein
VQRAASPRCTFCGFFFADYPESLPFITFPAGGISVLE